MFVIDGLKTFHQVNSPDFVCFSFLFVWYSLSFFLLCFLEPVIYS